MDNSSWMGTNWIIGLKFWRYWYCWRHDWLIAIVLHRLWCLCRKLLRCTLNDLRTTETIVGSHQWIGRNILQSWSYCAIRVDNICHDCLLIGLCWYTPLLNRDYFDFAILCDYGLTSWLHVKKLLLGHRSLHRGGDHCLTKCRLVQWIRQRLGLRSLIRKKWLISSQWRGWLTNNDFLRAHKIWAVVWNLRRRRGNSIHSWIS